MESTDMASPRQMYDNELNPLKGWPSPYAVDKAADVDLDSDDTIYNGMVMSLNSSANLQKGLANGAMAIFSLNNSFDYDVVGDDGNLVGGGDATPRMSGLVACGAYELESTEYDAEESYAPNAVLTAGAPGEADAGTLKPGEAYVNTICGVVSDGVVSNERAISVLRFWPVWLPPLASDEALSSAGLQ